MRRNSRDLSFKLIYESIFSSQNEQIDFSYREDDYVNYTKEEFDFAIELYQTFFANKESLLAKVEGAIIGYTLNRTYKIDLALLLLAITEHEYFQTPLAIVTNEVIELAKIYSTEKSPKFINGVISTIYGEKNA
ncbi:MAG: transcription antitermination factor NusB [Christensenellales bacterium]|jgi:N utilization substance protein B